MARFSLIVPAVGKVSSFEDTLASVLRYRPDNAQVLVLHRGDYEDRYGLGKEVDFIRVDTNASDPLIELFNAGVKEARGLWIGFLRPGVQLTENWDRGLESAFSAADVASVSPQIVSVADPRRLIAAGVNAGAGFRRVLEGANQRLGSKSDFEPLGPTSWGAFYRRSILIALDECDASLGSNFFDLDLALSFSALGFRNVSQRDCVLTCAEAESGDLLLEAAAPHGCSAERALARFGASFDVSAPLTVMSALLQDLVSWPWKWKNLTHLRQRKQAIRFKLADDHHRNLLRLLNDQRSRLVLPGLHARVAAHHRTSSMGRRKAA